MRHNQRTGSYEFESAGVAAKTILRIVFVVAALLLTLLLMQR